MNSKHAEQQNCQLVVGWAILGRADGIFFFVGQLKIGARSLARWQMEDTCALSNNEAESAAHRLSEAFHFCCCCFQLSRVLLHRGGLYRHCFDPHSVR